MKTETLLEVDKELASMTETIHRLRELLYHDKQYTKESGQGSRPEKIQQTGGADLFNLQQETKT